MGCFVSDLEKGIKIAKLLFSGAVLLVKIGKGADMHGSFGESAIAESLNIGERAIDKAIAKFGPDIFE